MGFNSAFKGLRSVCRDSVVLNGYFQFLFGAVGSTAVTLALISVVKVCIEFASWLRINNYFPGSCV